MTTLFRNSSPGALTLQQSIALEKKRLAERRRQAQEARELAAQGRGNDTEIAHLARGELVLPRALQNPEVLTALARAAAAQGIPLGALTVGNAKNNINPQTGMAEFNALGDMGVGDWMKNLFIDRNQPPADPNPAAAQLPQNMQIPDYVHLKDNIQQAEESRNPFWFAEQVRSHAGEPDHKWDYKRENPVYEDFGNFNYGATGTAFGFAPDVLKRMGGVAATLSGTAKPWFGNWRDKVGATSYGDDPQDQEMIQRGIDYYRNGGRDF